MGIAQDFKSCDPEAVPYVKERFHRALEHFGLNCKSTKRKTNNQEDLYIAAVVEGKKGVVVVEGGYSANGIIRFLSGVEAKNWLSERSALA